MGTRAAAAAARQHHGSTAAPEVTKYSCAQDFMERSMASLQRELLGSASKAPRNAATRKNAARAGLALEHPEP
eukprot:Skav211967  [mRNA]  locus=scaffold433:342506:342724:- [translate_table: standard]